MTDSTINNKDISPLYMDIAATALLFIGCCLLQLLNLGYADWYYIISIFIALGCGIFHTMILNRNYATGRPGDFGRNALLTSMVILISVVLTSIVTLFGKFNFNFLTFQLAFIIPFLTNQAFNYFLRIPADEYKLWYYPIYTPLPTIDRVENTETEKIKFVLSKEFHDIKQTSFILDNTPVDTPLGQVFYNLINKSNGKKSVSYIRYTDENDEPFGWLFYIKKGWLKSITVIDPDLSFRENQVHSNEVIFATREKYSEQLASDFVRLGTLVEN